MVTTWDGKWYDRGQMHDHCIVLLSYMEKHRWEKHTIRGLADLLGIPKSSLHDILQDAFEDKPHSLLFRVGMAYGFDFKVYLRPSSDDERVLIDVVKYRKEYEWAQ